MVDQIKDKVPAFIPGTEATFLPKHAPEVLDPKNDPDGMEATYLQLRTGGLAIVQGDAKDGAMRLPSGLPKDSQIVVQPDPNRPTSFITYIIKETKQSPDGKVYIVESAGPPLGINQSKNKFLASNLRNQYPELKPVTET